MATRFATLLSELRLSVQNACQPYDRTWTDITIPQGISLLDDYSVDDPGGDRIGFDWIAKRSWRWLCDHWIDFHSSCHLGVGECLVSAIEAGNLHMWLAFGIPDEIQRKRRNVRSAR